MPSPATVYPGVLSGDAIQKILFGPLVSIPASQAIDPHTANRYVITKTGSLAAITVAAPTAGADDGLCIEITSTTAFAHTVTSTGNFVDGGGHVNTATFTANGGGTFLFMAYQGKWYIQTLQNVTMS